MEVVHDEARHRFVVTEGEARGLLAYREAGPGVIDLLHTEVDPALRGRGVANDLARAALDHARAQGLRVIPTCPFVQSWLKRHPEELDLVAAS
ncbi:MAG: GNAT family N-acetyltransferase [Gemmatimonadota bacterium]